jgi:hypothetical protein
MLRSPSFPYFKSKQTFLVRINVDVFHVILDEITDSMKRDDSPHTSDHLPRYYQTDSTPNYDSILFIAQMRYVSAECKKHIESYLERRYSRQYDYIWFIPYLFNRFAHNMATVRCPPGDLKVKHDITKCSSLTKLTIQDEGGPYYYPPLNTLSLLTKLESLSLSLSHPRNDSGDKGGYCGRILERLTTWCFGIRVIEEEPPSYSPLFHSLTNLTKLDMTNFWANNNDSNRLVTRLTNLTSLGTNGQNNWISSYSSLPNLNSLLIRAVMRDMRYLTSFTSLKELRLFYCDITEDTLSKLTHLEALDIAETHHITDTSLMLLTNLKKLYIHGCYGVRFTSLLYLTQLESFSCYRNVRPVHLIRLDTIRHLTSLTCINLENSSDFKSDGIFRRQDLRALLPNLKDIGLGYGKRGRPGDW